MGSNWLPSRHVSPYPSAPALSSAAGLGYRKFARELRQILRYPRFYRGGAPLFPAPSGGIPLSAGGKKRSPDPLFPHLHPIHALVAELDPGVGLSAVAASSRL